MKNPNIAVRSTMDCGSLLPLSAGSPAAAGSTQADTTRARRQQGWLEKAAAGCRSPRSLRLVCRAFLAALTIQTSLAQTTYEQRHADYFDDISTRGINLGQTDGPHRAGRTGFWTTQGKLQRGNFSPGVWSQLKTVITNADGAQDAGGANGGFSGWPGMDTYRRWQHLMPQDVKDAYAAEYVGMQTYGNGSTPNQRMMWAAACRLACETWGTAAVTANSNASNRTGEPTGKKYIETVCDRTVKYNFDERWAKHYLVYTTQPLLSIAQLSTDPVLANKARMTWNWGWMDIASFSFKGRWAIPAGRGAMTQDGNTSDISEHGSWLMFGGTGRANTLDYDQVLNVTQPAVGQPNVITQPPILPEMLDAATQRDVPFTRRGLARVHETQWATTYMTKDWTMYSEVEGDTTLNADGTIKIKDLINNGVPSNDWASERWAVMWDESGEAGLTMKPPTGYGWAQGSGLGPHEDVMQHEGTIVGVINFPADWTWKYTRDKVPTNYTAVINDSATTGRLFLHYSKVLVAITRSDVGNFNLNDEYTYSDKRGFAVECASLSEYPQATAAERLAAFKADILANPADMSQVNDPTPRMIYTTRAGRVLDITWGQAGKVDGSPIDYEGWPLNESPWSYQTQMGNMWVFGRNRKLLWNYKNWTESVDYAPAATTTAFIPAAGAAPVDVNLSTRVNDAETASTALKYRITGATHGTAELLADGRTARFTPAGNPGSGGSFTFTAGGPFPDHRFVAHYSFDQANPVAGDLITDASSDERHATLAVAGFADAAGDASVPAALAPHSSTSLRLTAAGLGLAKFSRQIFPATLNFSNHDWTFATWFKRESYTDDDFIFYIGASDGFSGSVDELQLWLPAQAKTLALRHYTASNVTDVSLSTAATVNTGEWHHAAVQFDRTSHNTGVVKLYLDGVLIATSAPVTWSLNQAGPVFIGGPALNNPLSRNFNGWLDDTVLLRGELSAAEIADLASGAASHLGGMKLTQTVAISAAPLPPANLTAIAANNAITLAWGAVGGASGYTIMRSAAAGGPFTAVATGVSGTSYTDLTAAFGTTWHYRVAAVNSIGTGATSNTVQALLPLTEPGLWSGGAMNAWTYAARIAFTGYSGTETLSNFPLLVRLDAATVPGFSHAQMAQANAADLRFTDAAGTTVLSHEWEHWNPSGTSLVWVKVPALTKGGSILCFWGNAAAPAPPAAATTWSDGYTGVWHLNATAVTDSTSPAQNATSTATATTGKVASALQHNGTSQQTVISNAAELNVLNNYELSGWFKIAAADRSDYRTLWAKETSSGTRNWWMSVKADGRLWWKSSAGIDMTSPGDVADGQWHMVSAVHDGTTARLYIDGVQVATGSAPAQEDQTTYHVRLGSENETRWWKGALDEFRLSNVKRSASWIRAVFDNISGAAWVRTAPATTFAAAFAPVVNTRAAGSVGSTGATLNGFLAATGGSPTSVTIYHGSTDGGTVAANWAGSLALGTRSAGNFGGAVSGLPPGTLRYCRAFASNATGSAWAPETVSFITDSAAPTGLTAAPAGGRVSLTWNAAPGAVTYQVKRATVSGGPYTTVISGVLGTTALDATAEAGTTSYYVVTAVNAGGESAASAEVSVPTLAAPSLLTATAGNASVALTWPAVSGASAYVLRRATNVSGPFSVLQSALAGTSFTDSTALNGTTYLYTIAAANAVYESAPSAAASATPAASIAAPSGLVGTPADASAILTWNAVPGATHYRVKRATVSGGPFATIGGVLYSPGFTNTTLSNGTTYYFVVSAWNGSVESPNSAQVAVTPGVTPTTFTTASAGNWSAAAWSPQPPVSSFATTIVLNNSAAVSSADNLGLLLANRLQLTGAAVTLSGDPLFFAGSSAGLTTTADAAHSIANTMTLDAATAFSIAANSTTLAGSLNGAGGITKSGAGRLILTAANAQTGATNITAGTIQVRHSQALGAGSVTVADGATLELQGGINVRGKRATLTGSGSNGALRNVSGNNEWSGEITAVAASGITRIGGDAGTLTLSGELNQDNGSSDQLVFQGDAQIIVTGNIDGVSRVTRSSTGTGVVSLLAENTFRGATNINGGTLEVDSISSLTGEPGDEEVALTGSSLGAPETVSAGTISIGFSSTTGRLRFIGPRIKTDRVIALSGSSGGAVIEQNGSGLLTFLSNFTAPGAGSKTLTLTGTGEGLIAGIIPDNSAANRTSLNKTGSGLWTLGGANTFSGAATVTSGGLRVNGSLAAATTVKTGARLSGTGTLAAVTVESGGTLAPGSEDGTLTTGALTVQTGGSLEMLPGADTLVVNGALSLAGTLHIPGTNPPPDGTYTLITYSGALSGTGLTMGTAPAGSGYTIDTSTPGVVKLLVSYVPFSGTVIAAGSGWKYFVPSAAISSTWTHIGFDDSAWPAGNTEIGYGDGGEPTEINVSSGKPPAIYARRRFTATANDLAHISALTLHLLRDDGAVVYLNGIEIRRDNMPAGPVNWNTYASASVANADETTFFPSSVDPSLLNAGENVLAAEIHQRDATSTDISFNLGLVPVAGDPDTDDDGLVDAWEQRYFGSLAQNGLADADRDGLNNFTEMKTRTSPVSAADALRLTSITMPTASQVQLTWNTVPGVIYQVRQSDDLSGWTDASASMLGDGNAAVFHAPIEAGTTRRFYQIFLP